MHPANQRLGNPDKLSQGTHKQTNYPSIQWENTLDKRGTSGSVRVTIGSETEHTEKGQWRIKEQSRNIGLPMLQEARHKA